jgi:hypothetical protein
MIWALALLLAHGMASTAQADFTVTDSSQVLAHLVGAQTGQPFSSVQCGQTTTAQSPVPNCKVSCTDSFCTSQCDDQNASNPVTYQLTVADCSASQFSIYGDNGLSISVSADEYAANGNTWVLPFLRSAGFFVSPDGQAQIESMYFQEAQFVGGGKIAPIMPWILTGTLVFPGAEMGVGFELWFDPQFSGAEQILMFRLGDDILYQLRGLILGPNQ